MVDREETESPLITVNHARRRASGGLEAKPLELALARLEYQPR